MLEIDRIVKNLGEAVQKIRILRNLSGNELAAIADVGQSTISDIEAGKRPTSLVTLIKICNALGIGFKDLFEYDQQHPSDIYRIMELSLSMTPAERKSLIDFLTEISKR